MIPNSQLIGLISSIDNESREEDALDLTKPEKVEEDSSSCLEIFEYFRDILVCAFPSSVKKIFSDKIDRKIISSLVFIGCPPLSFNYLRLSDKRNICKLLSNFVSIIKKFDEILLYLKNHAGKELGLYFGILRADKSRCAKHQFSIPNAKLRTSLRGVLLTIQEQFEMKSENIDKLTFSDVGTSISLAELQALKNQVILSLSYYLKNVNGGAAELEEIASKNDKIGHCLSYLDQAFSMYTSKPKSIECSQCKIKFDLMRFNLEAFSNSYFVEEWDDKSIEKYKRYLTNVNKCFYDFELHIKNHKSNNVNDNNELESKECTNATDKLMNNIGSQSKINEPLIRPRLDEKDLDQICIYAGEGTIKSSYKPTTSNEWHSTDDSNKSNINTLMMIPELKDRLQKIKKGDEDQTQDSSNRTVAKKEKFESIWIGETNNGENPVEKKKELASELQHLLSKRIY